MELLYIKILEFCIIIKKSFIMVPQTWCWKLSGARKACMRLVRTFRDWENIQIPDSKTRLTNNAKNIIPFSEAITSSISCPKVTTAILCSHKNRLVDLLRQSTANTCSLRK